MPELPEVETIRRQLAPMIEGRRIAEVLVSDPRLVAPTAPRRFADRLTGRRIENAGRRGKYFEFTLDDGAVLVMHLRMTGNLLYVSEVAAAPENHSRALLLLEGGAALVFTDPRRFGTAEILESDLAAGEYFAARLGPEPFDAVFDGDYLHGATRRRNTPIKAVLLDQRRVAGIGNIYADEALFRAGIAPHRRAARLTRAQCERLSATIQDALCAGIDAKGASIDDFRDAYGVRGSFQDQFLVHRREGLPCPQCGAPVVKTRVAGRGTYFCKTCQRG